MSDRSRRFSTIEATKSQEERNRVRAEIRASREISTKLSDLIALEEAELEISEEEFQNIAETTISDKPAPPVEIEGGTTDLGASGGSPRQVQETLDIDSDDSDNLFEDPLHAVRTPIKDSGQPIKSPEILPGPAERTDPENWSQVNQFFPAGCVFTPQLLPRPQISSVDSNSSVTAPPVLNLPNAILGLNRQVQNQFTQ